MRKTSGKVFIIKYEDNTSENFSIEYFADYSSKARIKIGGLVFRFVRTFQLYTGYFITTLVEIIDSGKRVCKFCDRESNNVTLSEIETFSIIKSRTNDERTRTCSDDDGDYNDDHDEDFKPKSDTSSYNNT